MGFLTDYILPHFNFWIYVILMMIGMYAMITKNNLIKKVIGMSIFQTAIILFYVSLGAKEGAKIPILVGDAIPHGAEHGEAHAGGHAEEGETTNGHEWTRIKEGGEDGVEVEEEILAGAGAYEAAKEEGGEGHHEAGGIDPDLYANPLPHVLMLTAIVVGVATLGVALAIVQMIYREYGTLEEDEILAKVKKGDGKHG
jgi:multicomponent Na+:H+ antiporter subunit C